jgi:hypothetical protein
MTMPVQEALRAVVSRVLGRSCGLAGFPAIILYIGTRRKPRRDHPDPSARAIFDETNRRQHKYWDLKIRGAFQRSVCRSARFSRIW